MRRGFLLLLHAFAAFLTEIFVSCLLAHHIFFLTTVHFKRSTYLAGLSLDYHSLLDIGLFLIPLRSFASPVLALDYLSVRFKDSC